IGSADPAPRCRRPRMRKAPRCGEMRRGRANLTSDRFCGLAGHCSGAARSRAVVRSHDDQMTEVGGPMREKVDALPTCGCFKEMKAEVEREAVKDGLSMADATRLAVARWLRAHKQEDADAA